MDQRGRAEAVGALLRQLAIGLSTYRLYPGDLTQPALQTAVDRISAAFGPASAQGTVDVTVHGGRFHVDGDDLHDDRLTRLADACFSCRVEYLLIDRAPVLQELAAFYDAVSRDPDEVADAGGVGALLSAQGVDAIVARVGAPSPTAGDEEGLTDTTDDTPTVSGTQATLPQLTVLPTDTADTLYDRLRAASDTLDDDASGRSTFYRTAAELVPELGPDQQNVFGGLVLDRVATDTFADRYASHLTDPQAVDLIAATADRSGAEPVELAMTFVRHTGRQQALVALVQDLVADAQHRTTSGADRPLRADDRLRDGFPADAEDRRCVGLTALRDYLQAEDRPQQLEPVATAITDQLRVDVGDAAAGRITDLLDVVDGARTQRSGEARTVLLAPRRRALTPAVVMKLAAATAADPRAGADVLRPFGETAVDAVVTALGANRPHGVTRLLALLAALVGDRPTELERHVATHDWQVARDLATVLRMVGGPATAPPLERLARHDHVEVRRQAFAALTHLPPSPAATALARVIAQGDVPAEQREALAALVATGAPEVPELLRDLAARDHRNRLPWLLRWRARRTAARLVST